MIQIQIQMKESGLIIIQLHWMSYEYFISNYSSPADQGFIICSIYATRLIIMVIIWIYNNL